MQALQLQSESRFSLRSSSDIRKSLLPQKTTHVSGIAHVTSQVSLTSRLRYRLRHVSGIAYVTSLRPCLSSRPDVTSQALPTSCLFYLGNRPRHV
eukprot:3940713-Rhodomonas_salina.4